MTGKIAEFKPEFVETMPDEKQEGVLYISMEYGGSGHRCPCGCGEWIWLPFNTETVNNPHEWKLTNNNNLITFEPSIGSFQIPCKSHYYIRENKVVWC
jgi:hypothetical protein